MPLGRNVLRLIALFNALVARIREHVTLLTMQQRIRLRDIVDVDGRSRHGVHQSRFGIHADMGVHTEMPLVSLLL
jgi:hypothetical protein